MEKSEILQAISTLNESMRDMMNDHTQQLRTEINQINKLNEERLTTHEGILKTHEYKITTSEKTYRQNNVLLYGLNESEKNRKELEEMVIQLFTTDLQIPINIHEVDFIRRLGPKTNNKVRPIQVRLLAYRKALDILSNRGKLKGTIYRLHEDLPKEVIEVRRSLIPLMKKYREQGHYAVINYDKLYVNGKVLKKEELVLPEVPTTIPNASSKNKKTARQPSDDSESLSPAVKQFKDRKTTTIRRNSISGSSKLTKNNCSNENITQYFQTVTSTPAFSSHNSNATNINIPTNTDNNANKGNPTAK